MQVSSMLVKCEHSLIQLIAEAYRKRPGALLCLNSLNSHMNTKTQTKTSYWLSFCEDYNVLYYLSFLLQSRMPGEATETVPVTEQEMQQPQAETG